MAKTNNSNVIEDDILYVKGGLPFKFAKKVSDEEKTLFEMLEQVFGEEITANCLEKLKGIPAQSV